MVRTKGKSPIIEKAELRCSGLKAIDPNMDFGNDRTLKNVIQKTEKLRAKINEYNTAKAIINSSKNEIQELEKTLADLLEQMLIAVAFKYGKDSREYEMAGGVRKSDRIRRSTTSRLKAGADISSRETSQTA